MRTLKDARDLVNEIITKKLGMPELTLDTAYEIKQDPTENSFFHQVQIWDEELLVRFTITADDCQLSFYQPQEGLISEEIQIYEVIRVVYAQLVQNVMRNANTVPKIYEPEWHALHNRRQKEESIEG